MKRVLMLGAATAMATSAMAMSGVENNGEAAMRAAQGLEPHPMALAILAFGVICYFVPTIVAACRRKVLDFPMIFLVNASLGWTVIGWGVAMGWAISERVRHEDVPHAANTR